MGQIANPQDSGDPRTRVFLSYSRKDAALVGQVAEGLLAAGFLADYDQAAHDPHNVSAGISAEDEWWKRLQEMIAAADVMVFLVSPDSAASTVCDEEIAYARALGKRIIAVLARPVNFAKAPPRLSALNVRIDFSDTGPGFEAALAGLVSALAMNVGWHRDGRQYAIRVQEWDSEGRPKSKLLREGAVEEAERWALARPRNEPEPGELFLAWIAASRAQIRRDAAVRAFWRRVTAVFVVTTLVATVAGAWFVINGQRNLGRSESLMLARTSDQFFNRGDYMRALHLAILASRDTFLAPSTDEAKAAFAKSAQAVSHVATLDIRTETGGRIADVLAMAGGQRLLVRTTDGIAELWDVASASRIGGQIVPKERGATPFITVSTDTRRAVIHWGNEIFCLDAETGTVVGPLTGDGSVAASMTLVAFSPDGSRFVARDSENGLGLRDGTTGQRIAGIGSGPPWSVLADVSADGRIVVTADESSVSVWRGDTGAPTGAPWVHGGEGADSVIVSPDGTRVMVAIRGVGSVYLDITSGAPASLGLLSSGRMQEAFFFPGADRLVTMDETGAVQVRQMSSGAPIGETAMQDGSFLPNWISEAQGQVLTRSYLSGIKVLSLETGEVLSAVEDTAHPDVMIAADRAGYYAWTGRDVNFQPVDGSGDGALGVVNEHPGFIEDIVLSADGRQMITFSADGEMRVWDTSNGLQQGGVYPHTNYNARQGFLGSDGRVLSVTDNRIQIWRTGPFAVAGPPPDIDGTPVADSILSPDERYVMAWTQAGIGILWNMQTVQTVGPEFVTGEQGFWGAVFDPGGEQLALWFENTIQIIDTATGEGREAMFESGDVLTNGQFTEDGTRLVSLDAGGEVRIWDTKAMKAVGAPLRHEGYGTLAVDAADSRMIVWEGANARLVDLRTGAVIGGPKEHAFYGGNEENILVLNGTFSPDGRFAATWNSAELRIWDAASGAQIGEPLREGGGIFTAAFTGDGTQVLLIGDGGAQLFGTATGAAAGPAFAAGGDVTGGAVSLDGRIAATWGDDAMLRLWRTGTGEMIGTPAFLGLIEQSGTFTPDGRRLLLTEPSGSFRIVDTATGDLVSVMVQPDFAGGAVWKEADGILLTNRYNGEVRRWDISDALRRDAAAADVAQVCAAKLSGNADAAGVPLIRRLDAETTFAAPILRGREGEDVCTPPAVPWWETAAGVVFGWAFR